MRTDNARVLAVDPNPKGVGYAVFEGSDFLLDWGVAIVRGVKNAASLERVIELCERWDPAVIVIEDYAGEGSRRDARVRLYGDRKSVV